MSQRDVFVAQLVGMGFDVDTAGLAFDRGFSSLDAAITWILEQQAHKPFVPPSYSTLVSSPSPPPPPPPSSTTSLTESTHQQQQQQKSASSFAEPLPLQSRLTKSQAQVQADDDFQRKQREQVEKEARKAKQAKNEEKMRILKELEEDKKMRAMRFGGSAPASGAASGPHTLSTSHPSTSASSAPPSTAVEATIQIRFSNGTTMKKTLPASAPFSEVLDAARDHSGNPNLRLMQSFPKKVFGDSDNTKLLKDLGLVPRCALVETTEAAASVEAQQRAAAHASNIFAAPINPPTNLFQERRQQQQQHQHQSHAWGQGSSMIGQPSASPMDEEEHTPMEATEDGGSDHSESQSPLHMEYDETFPPPVQPHFETLLGGVDPEEEEEEEDEDVGFAVPGAGLGHRLGGTAPTTAAARRALTLSRLEASRQTRETVQSSPQSTLSLSNRKGGLLQPKSLVEICLFSIARRVFATDKPIMNLAGVDSNLAQRLLSLLVRENRLTSKTLRAFLPCMLQYMHLRNYSYASDEFCHALRLHVTIQEISLEECTVLTKNGVAELADLPKLRALNLKGCRLVDTVLPHLAAMSSLEALVLDNLPLTDMGLKPLLRSPNAHKLKLLSLNGCRSVSNPSLELISAFPNLKHLGLSGTSITNIGLLAQLTKLEHLSLASMELTGCGAGQVLAQLVDLSSLNLSHSKIDEEDFFGIGSLPKLQNLDMPASSCVTNVALNAISSLPLAKLDLTDCMALTVEGFRALVGFKKTLRSLNLSNTLLDDASMVFISELSELEEFIAVRTRITDQGASFLQGLIFLRTLSLSETLITNKFLRSEALRSLVRLTEVNLSRTKVSTRGLKCLLRLPGLARLNISHTFARPAVCTQLFEGLQTARITPTIPRPNHDDRIDTDSEEESSWEAAPPPGSAAAAAAAAAAAPPAPAHPMGGFDEGW